jgi:transaldolase/glucose-6-phosphate isomerase
MIDTPTTRAHLQHSLRISPGSIAERLKTYAPAAERAAVGLWRRDPSTWSDDPAVQKKIANRLGWLDSPRAMARMVDHVRSFAEGIRRDGFTDVVLLGMGGSSLAPEVLRAVLGVAPGWPRFHMLDSTDPAALSAVVTPPEHTLFLLSSKSGTTIEPNSLAAHFRQVLERSGAQNWANHFVAITDEGTALASRARGEHFREVFINPSDIGGRYSALSLFGLVPAALMGQDVGAMVGWAVALLSSAELGGTTAADNPAVALGLAMGAASKAGRDKLTLIVPPVLEPFGLWIEQLVAESTGKQGVGVVPIVGETPASPDRYGADRFFVRMKIGSEEVPNWEPSDLPVVDIEIPEPSALGAEFLRWEIATAVAGALLHINPFDEPNVQQAKDATRVLLDQYKVHGTLPAPPPDATTDGVTSTLSEAARSALASQEPDAFLTLVEPGDYVALLAYLGPDADLAEALGGFRMAVRDRTRAATMFGYGPRYLHSTGQLHKGGPTTGVFLLITATPKADLPIPGEPFSFGTLELAQALGDFNSLADAGRRALHVHLPSPDAGLLSAVCEKLLSHLTTQRSA